MNRWRGLDLPSEERAIKVLTSHTSVQNSFFYSHAHGRAVPLISSGVAKKRNLSSEVETKKISLQSEEELVTPCYVVSCWGLN